MDQECLDSNECCYQNCLDNHQVFNGRCNELDHKWYQPVEDFCHEFCYFDFKVKICPSGDPCDKSECCLASCPDPLHFPDGYHAVCSEDYSTLYDNQTAFCNSNCLTGSEYELYGKVHSCGDRDCAMHDCDMMKCKAQFETIDGDHVCGNDSLLYASAEQYCQAFLNGTLDGFKLCDSKNCETAQDCRYENCLADILDYKPRCDKVTFNFYTTKEDWCLKKASVILLEPYFCGKTFCLPEQCCDQRCSLDPHRNVCLMPDYSLYQEHTNCYNFCRSNQVDIK